MRRVDILMIKWQEAEWLRERAKKKLGPLHKSGGSHEVRI